MHAKPGTRNKWTRIAPLVILAMGFPPFINSFDNPRLAALRGPDVLQLIAIGMCIGGALALFGAGFLDRRGSS